MSLLQRVLADRRRLLAATLLVLLLATSLRLWNIQWSFSNDGVDEGIMLMRARMLSEGFDLYSEIPSDQAPLAILLGAALDGGVLTSRLMSAVLSVAAVAACMEAAKRSRGEAAMLATGLLLAVDFAFLRESRLFSLDAMSACFLAFSLPPLLAYAKGGSRPMLMLAGLLLGLSATSKLYGAIAVVGVLAFILAETVALKRGGSPVSKKAIDALALLMSSVIPLAVLLVMMGPSDMLGGMVFDQGHREFDLLMKLSIPLYFAFNVAYVLPLVYARALWARSPEARLLLCVSLALLLNFVLQPLAFLHNMVLLSPPLAVLVGFLVAHRQGTEKDKTVHRTTHIESKNSISVGSVAAVLFVVGVMVSGGFAAYGLAVQGKPSQQVYGEMIASWTSEDDWIISGDPLIAAYAERKVPPNMVNMGTRIYPDITLQDVEDAVMAYGPEVVVVCYRLFEEDMAGLPGFLEDHGYFLVAQVVLGDWSSSAIDTDANERAPLLYMRLGAAGAVDLPLS